MEINPEYTKWWRIHGRPRLVDILMTEPFLSHEKICERVFIGNPPPFIKQGKPEQAALVIGKVESSPQGEAEDKSDEPSDPRQ